jgi:hypothetical protein
MYNQSGTGMTWGSQPNSTTTLVWRLVLNDVYALLNSSIACARHLAHKAGQGI